MATPEDEAKAAAAEKERLRKETEKEEEEIKAFAASMSASHDSRPIPKMEVIDEEDEMGIEMDVMGSDTTKSNILAAYLKYVEELHKSKKIEPEEAEEWKKAAEESNKFKFATKEDGNNFCKNLAEKEKIPFMGVWKGEDGKPTGEYNFSNGDGKLYQGKMSPETMTRLLDAESKKMNTENRMEIDEALKLNNEDKLKLALDKMDKQPSATIKDVLSAIKEGGAREGVKRASDEADHSSRTRPSSSL